MLRLSISVAGLLLREVYVKFGVLVVASVHLTHLDNVPVVCELLQRGGVEAERGERGGRQGAVVAGLLQGGELVGREACQGGEQEADVVHVLQSCFLAPNWPAAQRWPGDIISEHVTQLLIENCINRNPESHIFPSIKFFQISVYVTFFFFFQFLQF